VTRAGAGRAGLAATAVSVACTIAVAAAGPSLLQPALPGGHGQPPWALDLHIGPYLAAALAAAGILLGAAGLTLTLRAIRAGWTIRPAPVLLAGVLATVMLSQLRPFGSSDFLSYAAYGRELVTGHNPYVITPAAFARTGDPVARAVEDWAGTPSVYGTLANGVFGLASLAGGASARLTVWLLDTIGAAAFIATGLLLDRLVRRLPGRRETQRSEDASTERDVRAARLRAALLWTCNPLLLQVLVAGGHVDTLAVCFAVAGLAVAPVSALAAGALLGCGFAVKPTVALVGAGALAGALVVGRSHDRRRDRRDRRDRPDRWPDWPERSRLWLGAAGFGVVAGADLLLMGHAGIGDTIRASQMVSVGSPWRPIRSALELIAPGPVADEAVRWCAVALVLLLGFTWLRRTSPSPAPHAWALGAVLAWLVAWPYVLPWYDALGWALLPLLLVPGAVPAAEAKSEAKKTDALSALAERVLLLRAAMLGIAYLPARSAGVVIPAGLRWTEPVLRSAVCPAVLGALTVYLAVSLAGRPWAVRGHNMWSV
jgi:hypothetical protein